IELKDNVYEVSDVWSRVRDKLDDAQPMLPVGAAKPDFEKLEVTAYAAIVGLVWDLPGEPNYAILRRHAESLEDVVRAIPGTRDVNVFGDPEEEIVAEVRHEDLAALGLTVADVARQLEASDAKVSAGVLRTGNDNLVIEVDTELASLERIRRTPIVASTSGSAGRIVTLGDIATVVRGFVQPQRKMALVDGREAVVLGALVKAEKRVDHWTSDFRAALDDFERGLPGGVRAKLLFEQNQYVETRLSTLLSNLLVGAAGILAVVWLMMGWRSALVVGTALPLSALMVLAGMRLLDVPMHQMSITGLIIALGLLIDNAIVMVDEVRQRRLAGDSPREAVAKSVRTMAVPLLGSTITTALSFAPIALMPGPAGEFVGSISISVILAIASSFLLAMTITPSLMAILDGSDDDDGHVRRRFRGLSLPKLTVAYRRTLDFVFRRPALGVVLGLLLPVAGFFGATTLVEQFFPPADRDQFQIQLTMPGQTSIGHAREVALAARELLLQDEAVTDVEWFVGESAPAFYYNMLANRAGTPQYAQALVQIREAKGARDVIRRLQRQLDSALPSGQFLVRQLEQGPPFEAPIELRVYGPDLDVLREIGNELRGHLAATDDVVHTAASLSEALPKLAIQVDEEKARLAGLDHIAIARQLDAALEGARGGSILETTEELPVRVRVSDPRRGDLDRIASLDLLPTAAGLAGRASAPLSSIADVTLLPEISVIPHFDTLRMNEVQAYVVAGVLPAEVLTRFQQRLEDVDFAMPPGYRYELGGEASKRDDAVGNLMSSVGILAVMMAATLVLSFSSFRVAALIGAVALLSVGLSLGALATFGYPFGFMAIVGSMGLIGVAINDTIVVLAALREDPQARLGHPEAVRDVVVRSTRHVLSTTLTTIAGFLPLILAGGGFWPPLATAIAGGVAGATILALYFAPSGYILLMCRGCREDVRAGDAVELPAEPEALMPAGAWRGMAGT
ncbi:efflux RND transporter permease subunit, partial [Pirellulales bacterium]|nr:efflux RND transporter permease subunit [Pirellulales bacterium]